MMMMMMMMMMTKSIVNYETEVYNMTLDCYDHKQIKIMLAIIIDNMMIVSEKIKRL